MDMQRLARHPAILFPQSRSAPSRPVSVLAAGRLSLSLSLSLSSRVQLLRRDSSNVTIDYFLRGHAFAPSLVLLSAVPSSRPRPRCRVDADARRPTDTHARRTRCVRVLSPLCPACSHRYATCSVVLVAGGASRRGSRAHPSPSARCRRNADD